MVDNIEFFRRNLLNWFEKNGRAFSWRKDGISPYEVLVGEIMLQKTRAENIVELYQQFIKKYPSPSALARADLEEIQDLVKPLGLYKRRSDTLKEVGNFFVNTGIPKTEEELKSIHGIGRYIANAFLSLAFSKKKPIVDTNVKRVYSRFFAMEVKKDPRRDPRLWEFAKETLPDENAREFNLGIVDLGAIVCKNKNPKCDVCPVRKKCKMQVSKKRIKNKM